MHAEAVPYMEDAAKLQPKNVSIRYNLGIHYQTKIKDYKKAEEWYRAALELDHDLCEARVNLGTLYILQNRQEDAIKELNLAAKKNPRNFPEPYTNLARLYLGKAVTNIKKAIELDPDLKTKYEKLLDACGHMPEIPDENNIEQGEKFDYKKD